LITTAKLTKAAGVDSGDAEVGAELIAGDDTLDGPAEVLGDSAYGSGQLLGDLAEAGHDAVIKPKPVPTPSGLENPFTADDFTVDHDGQTVTCPNGVTASFANKTRKAKFGPTCTTCPFRSRCTNSARGRTVHSGEHDRLVRAHRARWAREEAMRRDYRQHRPMIERSIAWMTRGTRTLRYRGVVKNSAWWNLRAAGGEPEKTHRPRARYRGRGLGPGIALRAPARHPGGPQSRSLVAESGCSTSKTQSTQESRHTQHSHTRKSVEWDCSGFG
jgi:hypothetical protein